MSLTLEQLAIRRTRVTATDATAIVGANPWKNAHDVWAQKVHGGDTSPNMRMRIGDRAEALVMDLLAEERGLALALTDTLVDPIHTWLCATPDRMVVSANGYEPLVTPKVAAILGTTIPKAVAVAEGKVVGMRVAHHWGDDGDEIPDYVRVQVQVQMTVTRTKLAYVAALLGTELRIFEVEHEPDLEGVILDECEKFHRFYLTPRVPPPPDATEASKRALEAAWPRHRSGFLAAKPEDATVAREYLEASAAAKAAETRMLHAGNVLRATIGEHEGIAGFGFKATWKTAEAGGVDWKGVAEKLGADAETIAEFRRPGSRRLLVKAT